ncbi:hypothetical protein B0H14DRAFT_3508633 [Mycena olivaceomarginata]|nr:hypothetical protein B0H14DRAFT_3508633 [Mycena olivaceomarginata]
MSCCHSVKIRDGVVDKYVPQAPCAANCEHTGHRPAPLVHSLSMYSLPTLRNNTCGLLGYSCTTRLPRVAVYSHAPLLCIVRHDGAAAAHVGVPIRLRSEGDPAILKPSLLSLSPNTAGPTLLWNLHAQRRTSWHLCTPRRNVTIRRTLLTHKSAKL